MMEMLSGWIALPDNFTSTNKMDAYQTMITRGRHVPQLTLRGEINFCSLSRLLILALVSTGYAHASVGNTSIGIHGGPVVDIGFRRYLRPYAYVSFSMV